MAANLLSINVNRVFSLCPLNCVVVIANSLYH